MKQATRRSGILVALGGLILGLASPVSADPGSDQLPTIVSEQVDQHGAKFTEWSDGTWRLELPAPTDGEYRLAAVWPDNCHADFSRLPVVNGSMEWGVDQTCEDRAVYPHWFRLKLQSSCDGVLCLKFKDEDALYSPSWENFSRVTTVWDRKWCVNSNKRKYRMVLYPVIHNVAYGPFFSADMTRPCSL